MPTPEQPATPTQSPSPTAEPSPTFSESYPPPDPDETEEQRAIREGWEAYREVREKYAKDPTLTDWTETQYVTTGEERFNVIETIASLREANLKLVGDSVYTDVTIGEPDVGAEGVMLAIVTSCLDPSVSERYVADIDTLEPADTQLTQTLLETVTMEQGEDDIWRAALYWNEGETC